MRRDARILSVSVLLSSKDYSFAGQNAVRHRETTYKSSYPGQKKAMSVLPCYIQKMNSREKNHKIPFPMDYVYKRMKKRKKKKKRTNERND